MWICLQILNIEEENVGNFLKPWSFYSNKSEIKLWSQS